jgi:hypothetical protein
MRTAPIPKARNGLLDRVHEVFEKCRLRHKHPNDAFLSARSDRRAKIFAPRRTGAERHDANK